MNKRNGLSQELIAKEEFCAPLTRYFPSFPVFFYKSKHAVISCHQLYVWLGVSWHFTKTCVGELKEAHMLHLHSSLHFLYTALYEKTTVFLTYH